MLVENRLMKNKFSFKSIVYLFAFGMIFLPLITKAETAKERCDKFKKNFEIKIDNPNFKSLEGNMVKDLPEFCTADSIILQAINILLAASGVVTVLFLMLGGFWYLASAGNEETAEKGKKTLINSVIGLTLVILSFAIVRIVGSTLQTNLPTSSSPSETVPLVPPSSDENQEPDELETSPNSQTNPQAGNLRTNLNWIVVEIPENAKIGQDYVVTARFGNENLNTFKEFCGGIAPENVVLNASLDGRPRGNPARFGSDGSGYSASVKMVSMQPWDSLDTQGSIILNMCSQNIAARNIFFEKTPVTPRG
jgi:hypothetical protein